MSQLLFAAGWTGKILAELPPSLNGLPHVNMLKHLNRILHYGVDHEWNSVLSFNRAFLRSIEQEQSSWVSWDEIDTWHNRHENALKLASRRKIGNGSGNGNDPDPKVPVKKRMIHGVPDDFIKKSKVCISFQNGNCPEEGAHKLPSGIEIAHACAICLKWKSFIANDHHAAVCPLRAKFLQSGGAKGVTTSGP